MVGDKSKMAKHRVVGLGELKKALAAVPQELQKKALYGGVRQGANTIRDAAKSRVGVDTGNLKKSIRTYRRKAPSRSQVYFAVWAGGTVPDKKGKGRYRSKTNPDRADTYYAYFHEYGTARSKPNPFMRGALSSTAEQAIDAVAKHIAMDYLND